jgi:hypothetical protein
MIYNDWLVATDDSAWQTAKVDYGKARDAGLRAAWHRCGYGDDRHPQAHLFEFGKDSTYDAHRVDSARAGLPRGAYFFPIPHASSPRASFDAVMRYTGGELLDLPFMVDMENPPGVSVAGAIGQRALVDWLLEFGELITAVFGRPIAYGGGFLSSYGLPFDRDLGKMYDGQWVANYGTDLDYQTLHSPTYRPQMIPAVHPTWGRLAIYQHTGGNGRCPGYPGAVDLDLIEPTWFQGALGHPASPAPTPPQPVQRKGVPPEMLVLRNPPQSPDPDTEWLYGRDGEGEWVHAMAGPADGIDPFLFAQLERRTLGVDQNDKRFPGWYPPDQGGGRNGPALDAMFNRARRV